MTRLKKENYENIKSIFESETGVRLPSSRRYSRPRYAVAMAAVLAVCVIGAYGMGAIPSLRMGKAAPQAAEYEYKSEDAPGDQKLMMKSFDSASASANETEGEDADTLNAGIRENAEAEPEQAVLGVSRKKDDAQAERDSTVYAAGYSGEGSGSVTMISSFEGPDMASDIAVKNGSSVISDKLNGAIEAYGDSVKYRAAIVSFRDGSRIGTEDPSVQELIDRLIIEGYTVAVETTSDGHCEQSHLTLHASAQQILDFSPGEELGCLLMLYDEYFGI